jgi:hypothetical protein
VPATLTPVPALPLTVNGKLDAARLPEPARPRAAGPPPERGTASARPADDPGEPDPPERIAELWQQLLGVPVGRDDNFFELGGNSLLAVRLNALQRSNGFPGSQLKHIFRNPTPRRLAAVITQPVGRPVPQEEA